MNPVPSSVKLFAPSSALGIRKVCTTPPKQEPKEWVGKGVFKCASPPFLLFHVTPSLLPTSAAKYFWLVIVKGEPVGFGKRSGQLIFGLEMRNVGGAFPTLRPDLGFHPKKWMH